MIKLVRTCKSRTTTCKLCTSLMGKSWPAEIHNALLWPVRYSQRAGDAFCQQEAVAMDSCFLDDLWMPNGSSWLTFKLEMRGCAWEERSIWKKLESHHCCVGCGSWRFWALKHWKQPGMLVYDVAVIQSIWPRFLSSTIWK